jgi:hypothetical protein
MLERVARLRATPHHRAGPAITPTVQPRLWRNEGLLIGGLLVLTCAGLAVALLLARRQRR